MTSIGTLGFIGLGVMGEPMCRNLATRSGLPMIATDLRPEPLARLASVGVDAATDLSEISVAHPVPWTQVCLTRRA